MAALSPTVKERATYTTLSSIFMALLAAFTIRQEREGEMVRLKPFELVQLGLATYRLGRMISFDIITSTYREPVTETVDDPSGVGKTVVPEGSGVQRALGELIACPICSGTWVAAGLVYGLSLAPRPTRAFLAIMSSVGAAELLNAATEALQWAGESCRIDAGKRLKEE